MIQEKARRFGSKLALCMHGGDPEEEYTYRALDEASGLLATGFVKFGLEPGDRVAVLCESRPRWGVVFFATISNGFRSLLAWISETGAMHESASRSHRKKECPIRKLTAIIRRVVYGR